MLDLSVLKEKVWDVKLFDGEVLHIKRPSQKMVIEMMGYEETFKKQKDAKKTIGTFTKMILDILNHNTEGRVFTEEYIDENFDLTLGLALVQSYMEFVKEVNSNPN